MRLDYLDKIALYVVAVFIAWQGIAFVFGWLRTVLGIAP